MNPQSPFWSLSGDQVLQPTHSTTGGLSSQDAKQRLLKYGANSLKQTQKTSALMLLFNQFKSPIILILIFAAMLSIFLKDAADAIIILTIVIISGLLGFWQERGASNALVCASCHGFNGRGGTSTMMGIQKINAPDIRGLTLKSEFDAEKFRLAVTKGQDPDGKKQLNNYMPRWNIGNDDLADLIAYLKILN